MGCHDRDHATIIELQLFGGFAAKVDGQAISGLRAAAPARLFAYLALDLETGARRAFLAGRFWPDGSDLRARRRLSPPFGCYRLRRRRWPPA